MFWQIFTSPQVKRSAIISIFFSWDSVYASHYEAWWSYKEKKHKKVKTYRKSVQKEPAVKANHC